MKTPIERNKSKKILFVYKLCFECPVAISAVWEVARWQKFLPNNSKKAVKNILWTENFVKF